MRTLLTILLLTLLAGCGDRGEAPPAPPSTAAPPLTLPETLALGQRIFQVQCALCHKEDGRGLAGQFPPLRESSVVQGPAPHLARIVLHGLNGPVEIQGACYNGTMPSLGNMLSDRQIAAVLTYVRHTFALPPAGAQPTSLTVTPDTVAAARHAQRYRSKQWTLEELQLEPTE